MSKKFHVIVKEVHYQIVEIVADDKDSAIEKVSAGEGIQLGEAEYDYTLDTEVWNCEEVNEQD